MPNGVNDECCSIENLRLELLYMTNIQPTGKFDRLAFDLPLLHRCNSPARLEDSKLLIANSGAASRTALGVGDGNTFFWTGRCAYDPAPLILIWAPEAERVPPNGYGAPWDTAGMMTKGTVGRNVDLDEAISTINKYSIPISEYRTYLSMVLESCFESPTDYIDHGGKPPRWYPGRTTAPIREADLPSQTFEVRRSGPVDIACQLVAIVEDSTWFADGERVRLLGRLKRSFAESEVEWVKCKKGEKGYMAAASYVRDFLRSRGHE